MAARSGLALTDNLFDLVTNCLLRNAERFKRLGGYALTLVDKSKQNVLGTYVVVI